MPLRYLIDDPHAVKQAKLTLEQQGVFNKQAKIHRNHHNQFVVLLTLSEIYLDFPYETYDDDTTNTPPPQSLAPKKYSVYPPMVLLSHPLTSNDLSWLPLGCTHVALNQPITDDNNVIRRPTNLVPIHGDFGPEPTPQLIKNPTPEDFERAFWCSAIQNLIWQTWAPRHTMFSRGNITEKARVLLFGDLNGTIVADLYCGIGYFSLSYLKLGAKVVGWDINPWLIEGFRRALDHAGYSYRVIKPGEHVDADEITTSSIQAYLFLELNEYAPQRLGSCLRLSHINLGLLPTSQPSWPVAQTLVNRSIMATQLHIHENVHKDEIKEMGTKATEYFQGSLVTTTKVKTFAPDVWHVVYDVQVPKAT